jgi:hypothetical protein
VDEETIRKALEILVEVEPEQIELDLVEQVRDACEDILFWNDISEELREVIYG